MSYTQQDIKPLISGNHVPPREPASRVVFRTPELRKLILSSVDRATLAGMMRLEREAVAGVAEVLYRRIHQSAVSKISRTGPRRDIYCDAVLEIDRSPLPNPSRSSANIPPIHLNPEALRETLEMTSLAFPRLRKVDYLYPSNPADDAYYVTFTDGVTVCLESYAKLYIGEPLPTAATLPITPKQIPGIVIRHSLRIDFEYGTSENPRRSVPAAKIAEWKNWLFQFATVPQAAAPDPRITGIRFSPLLESKAAIVSGDIISFLTRHRANGGLPIQHMSLTVLDGATVDRVDEIIQLVSPHMRTLVVNIYTKAPDWPALVTSVDKAFPELEALFVTTASEKHLQLNVRLSGLPKLRQFTYAFRLDVTALFQPFRLARHLCKLGTHDCVFTVPGYHDETLHAELSKLIKRLKSPIASYRFLHKIGCKDLDLWKPSDIFMADFDDPNGSGMRRLGWTKCSIHNLDLAANQSQLADMAACQADAIEGFRQMFSGALADLEGKDGDLKGQGEAIQARFGSVEDIEKRKKELEEAFAGMRAMIGDMEKSAKEASDYAVQWMTQQKGGKGKGQGT